MSTQRKAMRRTLPKTLGSYEMSNLQLDSKLTNKAFSQSIFGLLILAIVYLCFTAPASAQGVCLGTAQTEIVCGPVASAMETESSPLVFVNGQETNDNSQPSEGTWKVYGVVLQLLGLIVGVPMLLFGFVQMAARSEGAIKHVMFGGALLGGGVVVPAMMSMFL
jgi:hypothetical protein